MLWSNTPEFCLFCSNYAAHIGQYAPQIQHSPSLKSHNHDQQSLFTYLFSKHLQFHFSSYIVPQHCRTHLAIHICACINTLNSFFAFATLVLLTKSYYGFTEMCKHVCYVHT